MTRRFKLAVFLCVFFVAGTGVGTANAQSQVIGERLEFDGSPSK